MLRFFLLRFRSTAASSLFERLMMVKEGGPILCSCDREGEGGREGGGRGRERGKEEGREGERVGGRKGGREEGREGEREWEGGR